MSIEEIRARWAKATPGPWEALPGVRGYWCVQGPKETPNSAFPWFEGDAQAIAHAPEDIAYLLAELERERAFVGRLRAACAHYTGTISRVDYSLGEPNEMGVSVYDLDCDEERVVEAVRKLKAELEAARKVVAAAQNHDGCDQYDMDESLMEYDRVKGE